MLALHQSSPIASTVEPNTFCRDVLINAATGKDDDDDGGGGGGDIFLMPVS